MNYLEAILLGILQGLTEFLPVSSSGHLVLAQHLMGIRGEEGVPVTPPVFELMLHVGTLLAVIIYFRQHLVEMCLSLFDSDRPRERKLILKLGLAMIPAVAAALLLGDHFEAAYENPILTAYLLIGTGLLLLLPRVLRLPRGRGSDAGWFQALAMGIGQAVAILPGISRSGSTIVAGMLTGVNPSRAAEFSFLLAIPAIVGAVVYKWKDMGEISGTDLGPYLAGSVAALVFGLVAVFGVLESIRKGKFSYFGYYCILAGIAALLYFNKG